MAAVEKPMVDTAAASAPAPSEQLNVVETPTSPTSAFALSRFEFETGKGNEGTKILMVEWDPSAAGGADSAPGNGSDWEVAWEGKTTVLPIGDDEPETDSNHSHHPNRRVYFLLPPGSPVPALVSISHRGVGPESGPGSGSGSGTGSGSSALRTKPMPAIFPEELAGGRDVAGRRGVLHTIWAKKRLAELQAEIAAEMKANGESVGLEMAVQERQWIVDHFGLGPVDGLPRPTRLHIPQQTPPNPASPRSPVSGRLGEKLRGLKLATSPTELAAATQAAKTTPRDPQLRSLSPASSDVAVSSFAMFPGNRAPADGNGGVASLDAVLGTGVPAKADADTEEDLFALPMSPRSPEMAKSPFSLL